MGRGLPRRRPSGAGGAARGPHGRGDRPAPRRHGRTRPGRPAQRLLPTLAADRARPDRARRAAHPHVQRAPGGPGLRPPRARRRPDDPRLLLLGLSTRKVARALLPVLGQPVSPGTVSQVARQLDAAVAAFHQRPLQDQYRVLVLDGVVLRRKTGAGALARPVLVALGLRPDGKKEVIDFRLATAESAAQWELFLGDRIRRGLTGERLERDGRRRAA